MKLRIEDVVTRKVVTIDPDSSVKDATELMERYSISCLVVMSGSRVDGILTSRDVINRVVALGFDPVHVHVKEAMTRPVVMMRADAFLEEAIKVMLQRKIKKIPLVGGNSEDLKLVGLLSLSDIVENHANIFSQLWEQTLMTIPADEGNNIFIVG
ncbi:MAG: CBS domain-containing protein [Candidatus Bathyarchaeota archaeon]|nr:MAG: CBS domain-containing protein [Candidatus Bathyarchaeota archaeon]